MNAIEKNKTTWDSLYGKKQNYLEYPCENVIILSHRYFDKDPKEQKLLDLGFGSGNNLIYFINSGYECYGCEISPSSIELTHKRLDNLHLSAELSQFNRELPYPDNFFDIVVAWSSIFYNNLEGMKLEIDEVLRVLKPGGIFMATLLRENATLIQWSDRIDETTYKVRSCYPQSGAILYPVKNQEEAKALLHRFSDLIIGHTETSVNEMTESYWLVLGRK